MTVSDSPRSTTERPLALVRWLWSVAALIVLIVAVGGITRLTESGLSITEWKPVTGTLPPLSETEWLAEFEAYKQIPQYTEVNGPAGMTLAEYKEIWFWEWFHRLIARLIGIAFALPLAWFWYKRAIPKGYLPKLIGLLALGGLQGAIGWWMVTSGLAADVKVSHFRLATHLMVALITLAAIVWVGLDLKAHAHGEPRSRLSGFGGIVLIALAFQIALGALVAGLRAGYVAGSGWFNWQAWPMMMGKLWPDGVGQAGGPLHDPLLLHFLHRWWAWVLVALLIVLARRIRAAHRPASVAIHTAFGTQILLGIATVWSGMELWVAVLHQTVGALVVIATIWGVHALGRSK